MKRLLTVLILLLAWPSVASAETPTYGSFEFKLGGWLPAIDDELSGATPFADHFGDSSLLYGEIEIAAYIWQGFGKLGLSVAGGYSTVTGNVVASDGADVTDETSFSVWPIKANILYRLDEWTHDDGFFLVPAAKVGLDLQYWNSRDTKGNISSTNGFDASGWKWGYHVSLGVHLLLDIIDPSSAALFDLNWGINNSYLFAEFYIQRVDDFGADGFDLSDEFVLFGINFEY